MCPSIAGPTWSFSGSPSGQPDTSEDKFKDQKLTIEKIALRSTPKGHIVTKVDYDEASRKISLLIAAQSESDRIDETGVERLKQELKTNLGESFDGFDIVPQYLAYTLQGITSFV